MAPLSRGRVGIRETERPTRPRVVSASAWDAFLDGARKGDFDF
ncbi:DUF397 domain-containing protein [Nonomuraea endophytica]